MESGRKTLKGLIARLFLKKTNKITTMLLIVLNINELGKNVLIFKQDQKGGVCGIKGTYIG
jgi:hypothetical protein